jgi:Flp pilus assembly pilin Flp
MAQPRWIDRIRSRTRREDAQTMSEYALILGIITPAIIIAIAALSDSVAGALNAVIDWL